MAHLTTYEGFDAFDLPAWSDGDFTVSGDVYEADIDGYRVEISGGFSGSDPSLGVNGVSAWNPEGDLIYTFEGLSVSLAELLYARATLETALDYAWYDTEYLQEFRQYFNGLSDGNLTVDYFTGDGSDLMVGGQENDLLRGGDGGDLISGGGSGDRLYGAKGRDVISGDRGNDRISGGNGSDDLYGGRGQDTMSGGAGHDYLDGGKGDDTLLGKNGDDYLIGGDGSDLIKGGKGDDYIDSDSYSNSDGGVDTIYGGAGDDTVWVDGKHEVHGGSGDDDITVYGRSHVYGDGGDDFFDAYGRSTIEGGGGDDIYWLSNLKTVVIEEEDSGIDTIWQVMGDKADTEYVLQDHVENIDYIVGFHINKKYQGQAIGNDLDNKMTFEALEYYGDVYGTFTISGEGGNDTLVGAYLTDSLNGGDGDDKLEGRVGSDTLTGGEGDDVFVYTSARHSRDEPGMDVITDFEDGDVIDLDGINADRDTNVDDAFTYIGDAAFSGVAGELRFGDGLLEADNTGDGEANFAVELDGVVSLTADDFIL